MSRLERLAIGAAILAVALIAWVTSARAQTLAPRPYHIPAVELDKAISIWTRQSGYETVDDFNVISGSDSAPVYGVMTAREALRRLLAPSGLKFDFVNERAVAIIGIPYCRPWLAQYAPLPPCKPARKVTQL